jgi:hypothetical protein
MHFKSSSAYVLHECVLVYALSRILKIGLLYYTSIKEKRKQWGKK